MLAQLHDELDYAYRGLRLGLGFFAGRFVHCNLQVTYRCNFKCQICEFWKTDHRAEDEMTLADFRLVGAKLARLGAMIISLAGGEPLIRPDLYKIIAILRDTGHFPVLITNGWFVDDQVAIDIQRAGLQEISVSVDYAGPARHDAQRGHPGSFERAINALKLLHKHRPDPRHRVHMISVLMDDNLDDIEPLIKLSRDLGVTYMLSLYSSSRGAKARRLPGSKVTRHLLDLKSRYPEFVTMTSYIQRLDEAIHDGGVGNCAAGRLAMNIDIRGNVSRCIDTIDQPVGNILTDDVIDIRDKLIQRRRSQDCAKCWTSCRGFVESMMQPPRLRQFKEFYISVKPH